MDSEYCCKHCQDTGIYDKYWFCDCVEENPEVPRTIKIELKNEMHDYKTLRFESMRALGVV